MVHHLASRLLTPIFVNVKSYDELIQANFFYPIGIKDSRKRLINGSIFYSISVLIYFPIYLIHGFFLNFQFEKWPNLARILAYHPNTPFSMKIAKSVFATGVDEVLNFRLYFAYLYFFKRDKVTKLLKFDKIFDEEKKKKMLSLTQMLCSNITIMTINSFIVNFNYGWEEKDDFARKIAIIFTLLFLYPARYFSCDLFILYSYVLLINHSILSLTDEMLNIVTKIKTTEPGTSRLINLFITKYYVILKMVDESNDFISVISIGGKMLTIPSMALAWFLYFEQPQTLFLNVFKWFIIIFASSYTMRGYLLSGYLSLLHNKSKKMYLLLNSIMARGVFEQKTEKNIAKRKCIFSIIENISGKLNGLSYRDAYDGIVEQKDVVKSIAATLEFFLLFMTFTNRKI